MREPLQPAPRSCVNPDRSPTPVMDVARDFIVAKLGEERYSVLTDQPGMGYVRIARTLGKEALKKD